MGARGVTIKQPHILALTSVFALFPFHSVNTNVGAQKLAQIRTTDVYWTLLRFKLIVKSLGRSQSSQSFIKKNIYILYEKELAIQQWKILSIYLVI